MADTNHEIKVLPTGISDWDDIRYYDMFFVDKTEKLKSLVKIKGTVSIGIMFETEPCYNSAV